MHGMAVLSRWNMYLIKTNRETRFSPSWERDDVNEREEKRKIEARQCGRHRFDESRNLRASPSFERHDEQMRGEEQKQYNVAHVFRQKVGREMNQRKEKNRSKAMRSSPSRCLCPGRSPSSSRTRPRRNPDRQEGIRNRTVTIQEWSNNLCMIRTVRSTSNNNRSICRFCGFRRKKL